MKIFVSRYLQQSQCGMTVIYIGNKVTEITTTIGSRLHS